MKHPLCACFPSIISIICIFALRTIMKRFLFLTFFTLITIQLSAQKDSLKGESLGLIKWVTLHEAESLNVKSPKPFMIDVYTDWCGWCKHMMKTTFSEPGLAQYINLNFYPVRLNAETKDTIEFQGKKYGNKNEGQRSSNDFAILLLGGKMSYPTTVFFNNNFQFKLIVPGYLKVQDIEPILVYTTEYVFNTTTVDDFRNYYFKSTARDTGQWDTTSIRWTKLAKAFELNKANPKKILIFVSTKWCNSGKAMSNAVFRDSTIVNYVNKYFYPVKLDAESNDTLIYKGTGYFNNGKYGNFNELPLILSGGKLTLPSVFILDADQNVIGNIPQFHTPTDLKFILKYFSGDIYKTSKWEDYLKTK
jgi:thioredoxin-related protein